MRHTFALVCVVIMLAGLALQVRTYARAQPDVKARMRTGLIVQTIAVVVLTVLNINILMS